MKRRCLRCDRIREIPEHRPYWCRPCLAEDTRERREARGETAIVLRVGGRLRDAIIAAADAADLSVAAWARGVILASVGAEPEPRRSMPPRLLDPDRPVLTIPMLPSEREAVEVAARREGMTWGQWAQVELRRAVGWPPPAPQPRERGQFVAREG